MRGAFALSLCIIGTVAHGQGIDLHGPGRVECDFKWPSLHRPNSEYQSYLQECMARTGQGTGGGTSQAGPKLTSPSSATVQDRAKAAVLLKLKDPNSAKFGILTAMTSPNAHGEPTDVICGTVNAKNSYGGYAGATPFVYFVQSGDVKIKNEMSSNSDVMAMLADNIYRQFCLREAVP